MGGKKGGREGWKDTGLEGTVCRTRGTQAIQEIRDTGKEGCRKERFRIGGAQERRDAGKEGLRRGSVALFAFWIRKSHLLFQTKG